MRLCGDLGGTKVLLALVDAAGQITHQCRLASADFSSFDDLLAEYLRGVSVSIEGGCLAVAGPVSDDGRSAKITNLSWTVDCAALEAAFRLGHLSLINDFAGVALGVTTLPPDQLVTLQAGQACTDGVRLVIGAGTGLGMAILSGDDILPSEGGHVGFAPRDAEQAGVWQALLRKHGRVTVERVVSGPGLATIHRVLAGDTLDPAEIAERALAGDSAARHTIDFFFAAYGAFAGDMAMAVMARGGVILAGGVTQRLLPLMAESSFLAAFNDKAEHADLVRRMPVQVVKEPEIGLRGAAVAARRSRLC
ncbi:MAG: glucokinase [Pseudomonadota bacterium]